MQVWIQLEGVLAVSAWSALGTFVILYGIRFFTSLRVTEEEETEGLDYAQHGEMVGADN